MIEMDPRINAQGFDTSKRPSFGAPTKTYEKEQALANKQIGVETPLKYDLESVYKREAESELLTNLTASFYDDCYARFKEIANMARAAQNYRERQFADDEVKGFRTRFDGLLTRRVGRIIDLASIGANGSPVDTSGMDAREAAMYDAIKREIERFWQLMMGPIESEQKWGKGQ